MKRSAKAGIGFAVIALLVFGAYAYTEYRFSQKPTSLATIPEYPFKWASYPLSEVPAEQRTNAEQTLRRAASAAVAGYCVTDQRFLAAKAIDNSFIGDALRNEVNGYLNRNSSYKVVGADNSTTPNDIFYIAWQHNNPQRLFNSNVIVAAALMTPVRTGPNDEQIHIYGYFRLVRN